MNRDAQSLINRGQGTPGGDDACPVGSALLGEAAVLIWNDVAPEARDQFYRWHDNEHIPERLALRGFRRGRRFISPGHSPEWLTMYEADNLATLTSPEYLARLNAPTTATLATVRHFRNTSRAVCRVVQSLGSSTGGHVLAMRFCVDGAGSESMRRYLCSDAIPRAMRLTGVVACHLYAADLSASYADTAESTARVFDVPAWALLCETTMADAAHEARELIEGRESERIGVQVRDDAAIYALEICRLSSAFETQQHGKDHSGRSGAPR
jgi:hypothetical protein